MGNQAIPVDLDRIAEKEFLSPNTVRIRVLDLINSLEMNSNIFSSSLLPRMRAQRKRGRLAQLG